MSVMVELRFCVVSAQVLTRLFIRNCLALCNRQALHARTLGFVHPVTGEQMDFTSELPADLSALIEKWRGFVNGRADEVIS